MKKYFNTKDIIVSLVFIIFALWLLISKMPVGYVNLSIEYESKLKENTSTIYLDIGNGFVNEDSIESNSKNKSFKFYIDEKFYHINNFGIKNNDNNIKIKEISISSRNNILTKFSQEEINNKIEEDNSNIINLSQEFINKYNKVCSDDYILKLQILIPITILYLIFMLRKVIKYGYKKYRYKYIIIFLLVIVYCTVILNLFKNLSESTMIKSLSIPISQITQRINEDEVYKQSFNGDKNIKGISLYFGTNMSDINGIYLLSIYNSNDKLLYSSKIYGDKIIDNKYYDVEIENFTFEDDKSYYFTIKALENAENDNLVLWIGEGSYYTEGQLYENSNPLDNDIAFNFILNGPNRFLIVSISFTIFYFLIIVSMFYRRLNINPKKLIIAIYICGFIFSGFKMFFYLNYSKVDIYDELAHISYVAYLEENDNVIIPKFSDIKILMKYNEEEKEDPYSNVYSTGVYSGNYEGKFTEAINYLGHPPLYYHIMKLTNSINIDADKVIVNLTKIRVCNIFIILACIFLMFYIGYTRISKKPYLHLLFVLIINSVHMLLYEGASVNNDNLTVVGITIFILGLLRYSEKRYNLKTYVTVAIGIVLTVLSKLSAGSIVVIAALLLVIWNCITEKSTKSIFNKYFFLTLPIYLFGVSYFVYIFFKEGTFQPALSTYAAEQFVNNTLVYVQPQLRNQLSFNEFFKSFWNGFFAQWTAGVPGFSQRKSILTISRIGTILFWIIPLFLFTKYIRKNGDNKLKVYISLLVGTIVALMLQFNRAFKDFYFISGHFSCQSRYYVCLTLMFVLIIIFILETWMNSSKYGLKIKYENKRVSISREQVIMVICVIYSSILFFEGFIQCVINNSSYLL